MYEAVAHMNDKDDALLLFVASNMSASSGDEFRNIHDQLDQTIDI